MRIFALSDVHVDHDANFKWVCGLSTGDYTQDILILAGDLTDRLARLDECLALLTRRFRKVLFVPGNHDLWVIRERRDMHSLDKFEEVRRVVESHGASMQAYRAGEVAIVPLLSWYDHSFGQPSPELRAVWMDYRACRWPGHFSEPEITAHFLSMNEALLQERAPTLISFSHFLPRIDVMPAYIGAGGRLLYPVLGSTRLEIQLRRLKPDIHVYGHSHVNRKVTIDGICYCNNAFGYPGESMYAARQLLCIHET